MRFVASSYAWLDSFCAQNQYLQLDISIDSDNNNPFGYKDDTRKMIQREWRALEPQ